MYKIINLLITTHGFAFHSWNSDNEVWVCMSPVASQLEDLRDATADDSATIQNGFSIADVINYIIPTNWLPILHGDDFLSAMTELEKRLETIPQNLLCIGSPWSNAIFEALENLCDFRHSLMDGFENSENEILKSLPPTLDDINWDDIGNNYQETKSPSK